MIPSQPRYNIITNLGCKFFYIHYSSVLSGLIIILFLQVKL
nr:MAG TPA: hypothetical protein [Caudoviricetes sp.]